MVNKKKEKGFWTRNKYTLCLCLVLAFFGVFSYEKVRVVNTVNDNITNTTVVLDYIDYSINKGDYYFICGFTTLDADNELNFSFYPNETLVHMRFDVDSLETFEMYVYEGVNVTGGTPVNSENANRNSNNTGNEEILLNPTVTVGGELIYSQSRGDKGIPSFLTRRTSFILKENTTYMFNFISRANGNIISYCGEWYDGFSYYS